jgi:hypothetical protein
MYNQRNAMNPGVTLRIESVVLVRASCPWLLPYLRAIQRAAGIREVFWQVACQLPQVETVASAPVPVDVISSRPHLATTPRWLSRDCRSRLHDAVVLELPTPVRSSECWRSDCHSRIVIFIPIHCSIPSEIRVPDDRIV